jgi:hypothetical protein
MMRKQLRDFVNAVTENSGKLLNCRYSRGRFVWQRNRQSDNLCYYMTRIRGNKIKTWRIQYLYEGQPQSLFIDFVIPSIAGSDAIQEKVEKTQTIKTLLIETPIRDTIKHLSLFREQAPDLEWWDR